MKPCSLPGLPELSDLTRQAFWGPALATPDSSACTKLPSRALQAPARGRGWGLLLCWNPPGAAASAWRYASSSPRLAGPTEAAGTLGFGKQGELEPGAEPGGTFLPFPPSPSQWPPIGLLSLAEKNLNKVI